jgi:hypothetical protein
MMPAIALPMPALPTPASSPIKYPARDQSGSFLLCCWKAYLMMSSCKTEREPRDLLPPKENPINCLSDFTAYTQNAANTFSFTVSELY